MRGWTEVGPWLGRALLCLRGFRNSPKRRCQPSTSHAQTTTSTVNGIDRQEAPPQALFRVPPLSHAGQLSPSRDAVRPCRC
jgi:hypothetical protein